MNFTSTFFTAFLAVLAICPSAFAQRELAQIVMPTDSMTVLSVGESELALEERVDYVSYAFGYSHPVLSCAPLRVCTVELEEGERIVNPPIAGDNARWIIDYAYQGRRPIVFVKPTSFGIRTNLIVTTDRRVYDVTLDAVKETGEGDAFNPDIEKTRRVRFYYPGVRGEGELVKEVEDSFFDQSSALMAGVSLSDLRFSYAWSKTEGFPYAIEQVFDDGRHAYVKLPPEAEQYDLPTLYAEEGKGRVAVGYAYNPEKQLFITDRVFEKAVFVHLVQVKKRGRTKFKEETLSIIREEEP